MFQIDNSTAATTQPASTSPGTPGFFTDGNPVNGTAPTVVPAEWLNAVMMELVNVVTGAGLTLNKAAFNQVLTAVKRLGQKTVVLTDTGAANAYTATNSPALAAGDLVGGLVQQVSIAHANTGASTYSPDGQTAAPIYGLALQPLQGGELPVGGVAVLMRATIAGVNSGNPIWILMECAGGAQQVPNATQSQHAVALGQLTAATLALQNLTPAQFDNSTLTASTAFVQRALGARRGFGGTLTAATTLTAADVNKFFTVSGTTPVTLPNPTTVAPGSVVELVGTDGANNYSVNVTGGSNIGAYSGFSGTTLTCNGGTPTVLENTGSMWTVASGAERYRQDFNSSLASSGYQKLPSGLIIQWGQTNTSTGGSVAITYPLAFPNNVFSLIAGSNSGIGSNLIASSYPPFPKTGFTAYSNNGAIQLSWLAIGN
ncbi:hypothetical protein HA052_20825 [Chromobacterium haemolyticum]|uniref:Putative tail fiber protein gp53-like C-terminal domain-containing protein n=1 Tax=Chromobacterium fluminis TaxID=3044269 RepID=A0ABX0L9M9_9NEIS|nr:hypothetical protein [Chromobacterium haemolyticum]NHR07636.1 hypothetical protein [Chromobacterium haemolyticum]